MLTNLLVPGTANLQYLAPCLNELGVLNLFVYSHKRSTTPTSLGLPEDRALNLWPKEYLVRGHLKLLGWRYSDVLFPLYNRIWEDALLRRWRPAPVVHAQLWGAARRILAKSRHEGAATLGLVVNAHPLMMNRLLAEEADRIGIASSRSGDRLTRAVLEEVATCDDLHVWSEFTRRSFVSHGFPAERIHVIAPGQVLSSFYPATEAEQKERDPKFRVISVGAISIRKGQIHLLEAWRRLALPNAELVLVGGMMKEMEPAIRRYAGIFTYEGHVPNAALRSQLIRSSVMIVPSIEDGYALVVGEALACGIPVITTTNTGAADCIRDGINGYVVPIASPEAIMEKLLLVYRDASLLRSLQEGARATISRIGSWRDRARDFAALYRRIAPATSIAPLRDPLATESVT
jgi:glycosyltransferase involved in cell wall biosynthesis